MAGNPTLELARFASALEYDAIPARVREYCKDVLLDTLACALAGHQGEETHQVAALAAQLGRSAESSVIGGDHLSPARGLAPLVRFEGQRPSDAAEDDPHPTDDRDTVQPPVQVPEEVQPGAVGGSGHGTIEKEKEELR